MSGSGPDSATSREQLLAAARDLGIEQPQEMTVAELRVAVAQGRAQAQPSARGARTNSWLNVARQLIAAVVEQGLNMPDAAALIRGDSRLSEPPKPQPPLATVTLARIYAAQGHIQRAIAVLTELLRSEPDHPAALELRDQLQEKSAAGEPGRRRAAAAPGLAAQAVPLQVKETKQEASPPLAPSAEPQAVADAQPQPARPETGEQDVLVLLSRKGEAWRIAWELSAETEAARAGGIRIEIEWTTHTPSWRGPVVRTWHLAADGARGNCPAPATPLVSLTSAVLGLRLGAKLIGLTTQSVVEVGGDASQPPQVVSARSHVAQAAQALAQRTSAA